MIYKLKVEVRSDVFHNVKVLKSKVISFHDFKIFTFNS